MSNEEDYLDNPDNISFNSPIRGYSRRHSYYDNPFNVDFEYAYIELMHQYNSFVTRSSDMYSNIESCLSRIIERQVERRRISNRRRENYLLQRTNNNSHESQGSQGSEASQHPFHNIGTGVAPNRDRNNNTREAGAAGTAGATGIAGAAGPARDMREFIRNSQPRRENNNRQRNLFDMSSVIYSIPRTVLLNPNTPVSRSRNSGLSISEVEENTELITFGSIPQNDILNTECPITRETFTTQSIIMRLKVCKHCFIPLSMMIWLETHTTCPLCRCNVIPQQTNAESESSPAIAQASPSGGLPNEAHGDPPFSASRNTENINISNIFTELLRSSSSDFNNLSIDNLNDNSIMFSFDMPIQQNTNTSSNSASATATATASVSAGSSTPYIFPQIERLLYNTLLRQTNNDTNDANNTNNTNNTNNNNDTNNTNNANDTNNTNNTNATNDDNELD